MCGLEYYKRGKEKHIEIHTQNWTLLPLFNPKRLCFFKNIHESLGEEHLFPRNALQLAGKKVFNGVHHRVISMVHINILQFQNAKTLTYHIRIFDQDVILGGKHFAFWKDPFKKQCYLFALVAYSLESRDDTFITSSGRKVALRFGLTIGSAKN
ncbi:puromycin-sensitive aminopeptidase [Artemisia annua]|uniref:Puromycin-sensitive aminopeptidase n=1 Tax=Artemisia annua TaxID=35608 RepID=A0A2U1PNL2_ARTAN|nr:puromycin-sensitive aminopeptidase [Artemisia annua]